MSLKRYRVAGILFMVILGLGGLATWDEWQTKKEEETKKTDKKLVSFQVDDVVEFTYRSRAGAPEASPDADGAAPPTPAEVVDVTVSKIDGVWRVIKPIEMLADRQAVENFLNAVVGYQYEKVAASGADKFAEFGLKEAAREAVFKFSDGKKAVEVFVGNKVPVGYSVYARTSVNDDILIGAQHLLTAFSKTMHEFRDKTLVKIDEKFVSKFTYYRKEGELTQAFERKDGKYQFVNAKPSNEADSAEVKDFIDEINMARIDRFIDNPTDSEKKSLESPDYSIKWSTEGSSGSTELVFAVVQGKLIAAFAGAQISKAFELPEDFKTKIQKKEADFRNRRILRLSSDDIKQVDIDGDQYNLADGEWRKEGDAKKEVQAHLRAFLVDLEFAKTDEFIAINDPAVINLPSAPLHRIKLSKGGKDGNPITLDLFAVPNVEDKYFVKVTGASVIYRVARSVFKSMTPGDDIETNPLTDPGLPEPPDGTGFDEEDSAPDAP